MPASLWQLGEFRSQRAKTVGLARAGHASGMLLAQPSDQLVKIDAVRLLLGGCWVNIGASAALYPKRE